MSAMSVESETSLVVLLSMKPLDEAVWRFELRYHQYAEDALLYLTIPLDPEGGDGMDGWVK